MIEVAKDAGWLLLGLLGIYAAVRLATSAYFRSLSEYEESTKKDIH
jgi:hypothetical protein